MVRHYEFSFRVNGEERRLISHLAQCLQRSQSDAIRLLIREAAQQLAAEPSTTGKRQKAVTAAVNGGRNATND